MVGSPAPGRGRQRVQRLTRARRAGPTGSTLPQRGQTKRMAFWYTPRTRGPSPFCHWFPRPPAAP